MFCFPVPLDNKVAPIPFIEGLYAEECMCEPVRSIVYNKQHRISIKSFNGSSLFPVLLQDSRLQEGKKKPLFTVLVLGLYTQPKL